MSLKNLSKARMLNTGYALLASGLEYYNYMLLMYLIPIWGREFFPLGKDVLLNGFGIIFLTALTRPIAASIIGQIGDNLGRKKALILSGCIMSFSCIVISILPNYHTINWTILLSIIIICRILQIASAAGKLNGSAIFLIEHYPDRGGLISSIIWFATIVGMFLASVANYFCTIWGGNTWRIAIGSGGILSLISSCIAYFLKESKEYKESIKTENTKVTTWAYVSTFCIAAGISGMFYYSTNYIPIVLQTKYGNTHVRVFLLIIYGLSILMSGFICDKREYEYGATNVIVLSVTTMLCLLLFFDLPRRRLRSGRYSLLTLSYAFCMSLYLKVQEQDWTYKNIKLNTYLVMALGAIMTMIITITGTNTLLQGKAYIQAVSLIFTGLFVGPSHQIMNKLFPPNKRYKSVSLCYAVGTALFGGSSTLICLKLQETNPSFPSFFMIASSLTGLFGVYAAFKTELIQKYTQIDSKNSDLT